MLKQKGVSLIELMVALVIGALLVLGLVEIFSASKTSYLLAQGLSRTQENGRFAMEYLQRDLRLAGHFGCVSDQAHFQANANNAFGELFLSNRADYTTVSGGNYKDALRFDFSIQGYEAANTAPGNTVIVGETPTAGAAGDWSPALPLMLQSNGSAGNPPAPVRGSDIVVLRFLTPDSAEVTSFAIGGPSAPGSITVDTKQLTAMNKGMKTAPTPPPGLYGIADCRSVTMFHVSEKIDGPVTTKLNVVAAAGEINQSPFNIADSYDSAQARLYRAESVAYYVGINAKTNTPSLYRMRFNVGPKQTAIVRDFDELVPGVENLQLLYGQDSVMAASSRPTGYINSSETASDIKLVDGAQNSWHRVGAVKVGVLVRSPDRAASPKRETDTFVLGTKVTLPADSRYRSTYETNIALRNRLFGN
ncbi:PilW family protein [Lysobacter sp. CA199]|uniref:PilW family protein n=1 Tax=Lysobacter sp. CA199 TaxID=3455608 RepID=UPI003F8D8138